MAPKDKSPNYAKFLDKILKTGKIIIDEKSGGSPGPAKTTPNPAPAGPVKPPKPSKPRSGSSSSSGSGTRPKK